MKSRSLFVTPAPRRAGYFFAAMTAMLACAGCSAPGDDSVAPMASASASNVTMTPAQRQHIRLHTVAPSTFSKTVETTGIVDFDNDRATAVLAPFSGPVTRLLVSPGDKVQKGQVLAVVDSPDFAEAISTYRKALVTARNARRLADMDKDLVQHDGVAPREEQQAQTDAANAEADRDAAMQALAALGVDASTIRRIQAGQPVSRIEGSIRAPVAGTVVEKSITPGQLLQTGSTPCFIVADLSRVWVMAQISGSELASVSVGDPAEVLIGTSAKNNLRGTVANVSAQVNADTRAVAARVVVDNPDGVLKKQMYVSVRIHSRTRSTGLLVPVSAVLRDDENLPFVYLAQRDGSFVRRHVTLGYRDGDRYAIADGLAAGEQVVVDGGIFVQFMQSQ